MKFLSTVITPTLKITKRSATIDHIRMKTYLTEISLEITFPNIISGIKKKLTKLAQDIFIPDFSHVASCA